MAYKPFKMKGHTLPGIKQRPSTKMADGRASSSPFQYAGIFKNVIDEATGETTQVRISSEEAKTHPGTVTRTGEDIQMPQGDFSEEQKKILEADVAKQKKKSIKKMKKEGTYDADVKAQAEIEADSKKQIANKEAEVSPATFKSSPTKHKVLAERLGIGGKHTHATKKRTMRKDLKTGLHETVHGKMRKTLKRGLKEGSSEAAQELGGNTGKKRMMKKEMRGLKPKKKNILQKAHEKLQSVKDPFAKQKKQTKLKKFAKKAGAAAGAMIGAVEHAGTKKKKSPAKIAPLIAMAGKAIIGSAISKAMDKDNK